MMVLQGTRTPEAKMTENAVYQTLTAEGMPFERITNLINKATEYGSWDSEIFGVRLSVADAGTHVEFKIKRI